MMRVFAVLLAMPRVMRLRGTRPRRRRFLLRILTACRRLSRQNRYRRHQ
jgi:hypothetical protein